MISGSSQASGKLGGKLVGPINSLNINEIVTKRGVVLVFRANFFVAKRRF
jgi:hypothetical protein